ncbi:MAG: hypothetical protein IJP89_05085 [Synergistaceae bacterium]|nr:hypothetical protein [Synergistaceae bacterium]MBR0150718.1 hypothetical protein [Synergistaceae bacterium]
MSKMFKAICASMLIVALAFTFDAGVSSARTRRPRPVPKEELERRERERIEHSQLGRELIKWDRKYGSGADKRREEELKREMERRRKQKELERRALEDAEILGDIIGEELRK